jgi:hypothetical protein
MRGAIPPLSEYVLMAWCLVKHRGQLYSVQLFRKLLYGGQTGGAQDLPIPRWKRTSRSLVMSVHIYVTDADSDILLTVT